MLVLDVREDSDSLTFKTFFSLSWYKQDSKGNVGSDDTTDSLRDWWSCSPPTLPYPLFYTTEYMLFLLAEKQM